MFELPQKPLRTPAHISILAQNMNLELFLQYLNAGKYNDAQIFLSNKLNTAKNQPEFQEAFKQICSDYIHADMSLMNFIYNVVPNKQKEFAENTKLIEFMLQNNLVPFPVFTAGGMFGYFEGPEVYTFLRPDAGLGLFPIFFRNEESRLKIDTIYSNGVAWGVKLGNAYRNQNTNTHNNQFCDHIRLLIKLNSCHAELQKNLDGKLKKIKNPASQLIEEINKNIQNLASPSPELRQKGADEIFRIIKKNKNAWAQKEWGQEWRATIAYLLLDICKAILSIISLGIYPFVWYLEKDKHSGSFFNLGQTSAQDLVSDITSFVESIKKIESPEVIFTNASPFPQ